MAESGESAEPIRGETSSDETSQQSSWWGSSWLEAARTKSAEVLDYVKKDFDEFSQTVQTEVSSTASALKEKLKMDETNGPAATVKRSVTSFLNQVSDVFYIPPEDDDEPIFLDRLTAIIYKMGCDPSTFLVDPVDVKDFNDWQDSLNLESQEDYIEALLTNNDKLRKIFDELVPSKIPESVFWTRYLYRIHVARQEETQRQIIRKEAQSRAQSDVKANDLNWDEDEVVTHTDEIPEEIQSQLLAEYEKECRGRSATGERKDSLKCKDKGDMVLVSRADDISGSASPSKESSNDEEWEEAVPVNASPTKK